MKTTVFVGVSLDGFIARENDELDWLHDGGAAGSEDFGYQAFIRTVDVIVMGRRTYDVVRTFDKWPYDRPVVVLAGRPPVIPAELAGRVEHMAGAPADVLARLAGRGAGHVYVDGGRTIQGFLEAGLIRRLVLTRVPTLIGQGIPLFGPLSRDLKLRHVGTRSYAGGAVQSEYEVTT